MYPKTVYIEPLAKLG